MNARVRYASKAHTHRVSQEEENQSGSHTLPHRTFFKSLAYYAVVDWRHARHTARVAEGKRERERDLRDRESTDRARTSHTGLAVFLPRPFIVFSCFCPYKERGFESRGTERRAENTARLDSASRFESGMILSRRGEDGLLQSVSQSESTVVSIFK